MKYSFIHSRLKYVFAAFCLLILTTNIEANFVQQGIKLVGSGAVGPDGNQGVSVSLSSDGNSAIVGGWNDNGGAGAAWVFIPLPDAPVLLSPADTAKNVSVNPVLLWNKAARATSYRAQL